MEETDTKVVDKSPKKSKNSGAKGGTRYPKDNLEKSLSYAKKLVSKTHNGSQPESVILNGVFGSSTQPGKIRLSSTKQFGFLNGDAKGYIATELAKKINSSPDNEVFPLLEEALFTPKIFKTLYDTFVNDTVNDAKLKQQVLKLDVHPDNSDECVRVFKDSIIFAKLARKIDDDRLEIISHNFNNHTKDIEETPNFNQQDKTDSVDDANLKPPATPITANITGGGISNINVNIDVDPSMDPEKLEKLLKLLKSYGAI